MDESRCIYCLVCLFSSFFSSLSASFVPDCCLRRAISPPLVGAAASIVRGGFYTVSHSHIYPCVKALLVDFLFACSVWTLSVCLLLQWQSQYTVRGRSRKPRTSVPFHFCCFVSSYSELAFTALSRHYMLPPIIYSCTSASPQCIIYPSTKSNAYAGNSKQSQI